MNRELIFYKIIFNRHQRQKNKTLMYLEQNIMKHNLKQQKYRIKMLRLNHNSKLLLMKKVNLSNKINN